jgi:hypothetical protein
MRATISRAEVFALCRSLGADPLQTNHIEVFPDRVEITTYHLDENGNRHLVGPSGFRAPGDDTPSEVATETTLIPIVGEGNAETVRLRHPDLPGQEIDVRPRGVGQRAMAGWEVAEPPKAEPPKEAPPPERGTKPEAPAEPGASSSPPPRGRRTAKKKEDG